MSPITIEFFHDVICSFCFPMSYRMRQLTASMPELNIVHRSFALAPTDADFVAMFGSREHAKTEILNHWQHANQNDDLHRFNIAGMLAADFPFPTSTNGLLACKAASLTGGDQTYWDIFDALQQKLFVENQNIESDTVIFDTVKTTNIDFDTWYQNYTNPATQAAVKADFQLAADYDIRSVPTLIINGTYRLNGAQPLETIKTALQQIEVESTIGASCQMIDGKIQCD